MPSTKRPLTTALVVRVAPGIYPVHTDEPTDGPLEGVSPLRSTLALYRWMRRMDVVEVVDGRNVLALAGDDERRGEER